MVCTSCGAQVADGSAFCSQCGAPLAAAAQSGVSLAKTGDTPMQRPGRMDDYDGEIPPGVKGWSWGAFLLNWIWAIGNRTWIGMLCLIPYIGFLVAIWLGIKGREMAWKNADWHSVEHFNRVQKSWSRWAVGLTLGLFALGFVASIVIPQLGSREERTAARSSAAFEDGEDDTPAVGGGRVQRGSIDSSSDALPATLVTSAGTLRHTEQAGKHTVTLSGEPLFTGEDAQWQFPVRSFNQSKGREAVLMASSGGRGNSCETLFYFLLIDGDRVRNTPLFGTCAPEGDYSQRGDRITIELPKPGGVSRIVLREGEVIEDGRTITLDNLNDPSR